MKQLIALALALAAPAQVVRVCNYGTDVFAGWHRATIDAAPKFMRGRLPDGTEYAVGREIGLLARVVDLKLKLAPGQAAKFDLGAASPLPDGASLPLLDDVGAPQISGVTLELAPDSIGGKPNKLQDGAGVLLHWRGRPLWPAPMVNADVWLTAYQGQPWAVGEVVLTASNPAVPEVVAQLPGGATMGWTNGATVIDGVPLGNPVLVNGNEFMGNGQCRSYRFVVGWLGRCTISDIQAGLIESNAQLAANGISKPGLLGSFSPAPQGFDAVAWARERLPRARAALTGWDILRDSRGGSVGVSPRAGDTGEQEDQPGVHKGVEDYASPQPGPYWVSYYAGLSQLRRPCHHLEADGSPLDWHQHKDLSLWVSQPNLADGAVKDSLGKSRSLILGTETHGWEGPDTEHWFLGRLAQALQWTGSPALQWDLQEQARVFMFTVTVDPRFATTAITDASRAWGWEATVAAWFWSLLEDRELAAAVRQRMADRVRMLYPSRFAWVGSPVAWFDVRTGDARVTGPIGGGFTAGTLAYQQSLASLMQVAGETLGDPLQIEWAQRLARTSVDYGWTQDAGGKWLAWPIVGVNPDGTQLRPDQYANGSGAFRDPSTDFGPSWCAIAPWVVLRSNPQDARALAILAQLRATPTSAPNQPVRTNDWLLPIGAHR